MKTRSRENPGLREDVLRQRTGGRGMNEMYGNRLVCSYDTAGSMAVTVDLARLMARSIGHLIGRNGDEHRQDGQNRPMFEPGPGILEQARRPLAGGPCHTNEFLPSPTPDIHGAIGLLPVAGIER